jgi:Ca-activated chloride channel family protein
MIKFIKTLISLVMLVSFILTTAAVPFEEINQPAKNNPIIVITQLDTSQFPKVTVYVSVTDQAGEPIAVDPINLVLKENDQVIAPDQIQGQGEVGPLTTILAIDTSGSMLSGNKMKIAKTVANEYIDKMQPNDQVGIVAFSDRITTVQEVTQNKAVLINSIEKLQATGDTAMYDAALKAVEVLNPLAGRKAIIILTDGMDNRSENTPDKVITAIGQKGLSISTVGFGVPNQGTGNVTALDENSLINLAEKAGGQYGYANDQTSLQRIYEKYSRIMKSEYVITYSSPSSLRDGLSRNLTVSLMEGNVQSSPAVVQTSYNPGGLVPESGGAAPWSMFFVILGGLMVLLLVPGTIIFVQRRLSHKGKVKLISSPKSTRIKLK